ncbi:replication-relaxation family protein [Kitasatospora sp. NPDC051853]|uniref:replication-relaxation family protein n=1 Tax=Kitasatospora sp. NPDC051853 TaxID=3364058 RepID=UPI0037B4275A
MRGGVLAALGLFQRATPRELWPLVLPHQRSDRSIRDALGDLRDAGKVREELRLPDGRKLWCLTPAGRRDAAALLSAGAKLAAARPVREKRAAAYSEHALDVVATAGLLAKAGIGHLEAFSTEVQHKLPGRRTLFADLVLRDPGANVPVLLVEVDRENEGNGTLLEKLTAYRTWCELPARGVSRKDFEASLAKPGPAVNTLRLWSALYPATGREGLPPVALVLEAGRKRPRPGTKPLTPAQKKAKQERDDKRLLGRIEAVEAASENLWAPSAARKEGVSARYYHQALPVVATTLSHLRRFGADGEVWIRFGRPGWHTLADALDNPDGDQLLERQLAALHRRREEAERLRVEFEREQAERERVAAELRRREADRARQEAEEAAERERRRPACGRCSATLSDQRWADMVRAGVWGDDGLCDACRQADADQRAQAPAEAECERAAAEAAAAEERRAGSWWRRT